MSIEVNAASKDVGTVRSRYSLEVGGIEDCDNIHRIRRTWSRYYAGNHRKASNLCESNPTVVYCIAYGKLLTTN